jgi:Na+-transporting methylmalonyl-CoA/oxaloacetate decarboxylase gamma subunit
MQRKFIQRAYWIFVFLLVATSANLVKAQSATDLRFNEILVINDSNYVDDFGQHSPWIEIFNSAYNSVNIGGCYLTDDLNYPTKYWISTGDPATLIPPRCYSVFWADNHPSRGIFHLNFELEGGKTIALFDANGKTLIDKIEIPAQNQSDVTYGIPIIGGTEWQFLDKSTPGANNDYSKKASAGEKFVELDPTGFGMAVIAMMVVFSALAILFIVYKNLGNFFIRKAAATKIKKSDTPTDVVKTPVVEISGEVNAAIAMALYLYQTDLHDHENTVLTIQKVSKTYSPWSSKIYTLRRLPR